MVVLVVVVVVTVGFVHATVDVVNTDRATYWCIVTCSHSTFCFVLPISIGGGG